MSRIRKNTAKTSVVKKSQTMNSQEGLLRSDNTLCGFTPSGMYGRPMDPPLPFSSDEATITLLPRIGAYKGGGDRRDVAPMETGLNLTRRASRLGVGTWNLSKDFASGFTAHGFLAADSPAELLDRRTTRSQPPDRHLKPPEFSGPRARAAQLREATEAADAIKWFVKGIFTEDQRAEGSAGATLATDLGKIWPSLRESIIELWTLQRQRAPPSKLLPLQKKLISKIGCIKVREYKRDRWRFYIFPAEVSGRALLRTSKLGPP